MLLVLAVLIAHLGVLGLLPQWHLHVTSSETTAPTLLTRRIERANPSTPRSPASRHTQLATPPTPQNSTPNDTPETPPLSNHDFNELTSDLTSPLTLPTHTASEVDLPPFKRPSDEAGQPAQPTAFKPPEAALLKFEVQGLVKQLRYSAWGELQWQPNGSRYEARLEIGAFLFGSRTQTSNGLIGQEGLMPERFVDNARNAAPVLFQRDRNVIRFNANGSELPLLSGTQDRLSLVLQLSTLLAGEPERYPPGTMLSIPTVSQQDAEVWPFMVEKEESLVLPYGTLPALKLSRVLRKPDDQRIELWFAPTLGYLPVRLRITNADGDQVDQRLKALGKPGS